MPRIVMDAMQGGKELTWQQYASDDVDLQQKQCSWAPTEGKTVLWRQIVEKVEWHSRDVS